MVRYFVLGLACGVAVACSPEFRFPTDASTVGGTGGTQQVDAGGGQAGAPNTGGSGPESTAATTTTSGSGAIGGASGTGWDTGAEDCTNGVDDDQDGAADCADEKCQPYFRCVPSTPEGWGGPIALWEGDDASLPRCGRYYPDGEPLVATRVLAEPQPAQCPPCACDPPEGGSCSTIELEYYGSEDCSGTPTTVSVGETCAQHDVVHAGGERSRSVRFVAPESGGECQPRREGSVVTPRVDKVRARSCGGATLGEVGCAENERCAPRPLPPYDPAVCIFATGDLTCPAGFDEKAELFYESDQDGRSCRICTCLDATCDGGASDDVSDDACDGAPTAIAPGECVAIEVDELSAADLRSAVFDAAAGASCRPGSVQGPVGSYSLSGPVTYCCAAF